MLEVEMTKENRELKLTAVQEARLAALRRFNWTYLYIPLILLSLALLTLTGLMLWGALSPNIVGTREFVSGVADIIIILTILPITMLCLVPPIALLGFTIYRRGNRTEGVPYGRLQRLFWQIENHLNTLQAKTKASLPKIANPIIKLNSTLAFITTLLDHLSKAFRRN